MEEILNFCYSNNIEMRNKTNLIVTGFTNITVITN